MDKEMDNKSDVIIKYINIMFSDCMCKEPDETLLNILLEEYKALGGTQEELNSMVLKTMTIENSTKINDGSLITKYSV